MILSLSLSLLCFSFLNAGCDGLFTSYLGIELYIMCCILPCWVEEVVRVYWWFTLVRYYIEDWV